MKVSKDKDPKQRRQIWMCGGQISRSLIRFLLDAHLLFHETEACSSRKFGKSQFPSSPSRTKEGSHILNSSTAGHHGWHHCHPWPYVFFSVHVRKESEKTLGLGRHFGCLSVLSLSGEPSPGAEHVCLALFVHLRGRHWRTKQEDGLWLLMWKWHDMW